MKKYLPLFSFLFLSTHLFAQNLEIPNDLKLEVAEDYKNTEQLVIDSGEWLLNTPLSENPEKRKQINAFLMKWLSGSPTVSIELTSGIVPFDCADCLMSFLSGWASYSLQNNYSKDKIACAVAGAEQALAFYEKNKPVLGKISDMEKLKKQQKKGKLKKYVESKF